MSATKSSSLRSAASMSTNADSVAATNRREIADFDVDRPVASTAAPTGSSPAA